MCRSGTNAENKLSCNHRMGDFVYWASRKASLSANKAVQPTGASRLGQSQIERHRRLAPVADLRIKQHRSLWPSSMSEEHLSCRNRALLSSRATLSQGRFVLACSWTFPAERHACVVPSTPSNSKPRVAQRAYG